MAGFIKIGTRTSPLALAQVAEFMKILKKNGIHLEIIVVGFKTSGDLDRETPLTKKEGSDFFTKEIDDALKTELIDISLHSAKDLPEKIDPELVIASITKSIDRQDVLVSKGRQKLDELLPGSQVGTSSLNRTESIYRYRNDLVPVSIRGNVDERVRMVKEGTIDAVVLAAAGLLRLGLEKEISQRIPFSIINPHPMQGRLAVLVRKKDRQLHELLKAINDK